MSWCTCVFTRTQIRLFKRHWVEVGTQKGVRIRVFCVTRSYVSWGVKEVHIIKENSSCWTSPIRSHECFFGLIVTCEAIDKSVSLLSSEKDKAERAGTRRGTWQPPQTNLHNFEKNKRSETVDGRRKQSNTFIDLAIYSHLNIFHLKELWRKKKLFFSYKWCRFVVDENYDNLKWFNSFA